MTNEHRSTAGLSRETKETIARRSKTVQERHETTGTEYDRSDRAETVVERWKEYVADGDSERFSERLDREEITLGECKRRVALEDRLANRQLPSWVEELDDIVEYVRTNGRDADTPCTDNIPFSDALAPFVSYAERKLSGSVRDILAESAAADLARWLLEQLSELSAHALFVEFKKYVERTTIDEGDAINDSGTEYYDRFVSHVTENVDGLFEEYSFLGRLIVTLTNQWLSLVEEMCERVDDDLNELQTLFRDADRASKIVGVEVVGDAHLGGRRVVKLDFDNGGSVAYKPRNSGTAAGFNDLLDWINENSRLSNLETADILCRGDHSWMEWVEPETCSTERDAIEYYRRAGMLICLFYTTDVVDMHLENVIARGEQPLVIDLETLAHPTIKDEYRIAGSDEEDRNTVVRTGAVPGRDSGEDSLDATCFSTNVVEFTTQSFEFENVNTDSMELKKGTDAVVVGANLPRYSGEVVHPDENIDVILDGFRDMYDFILENRGRLTADGGPLQEMCRRNSSVSVILRNSGNYSAIQEFLTHHSTLRTGLEFGVKVESLAKPIVSRNVDEGLWKVYDRERKALRNWNCPRFTARLDETNLYFGDELVLSEVFEATPIEQMRRRIRDFCDADRRRQEELIRRGFSS